MVHGVRAYFSSCALPAGCASKISATIRGTNNGVDGYAPPCGLTVGASGVVYGVTLLGGAHDAGTVFELKRATSGGWAEAILLNFNGTSEGDRPAGVLILDASGNLYGTTQYGGGSSYGTVFKLTPSGGQWTESVKFKFDITDGAFPDAALTFGIDGALYGTAYEGGAYNEGIVFSVTPE